MPPNLDPEKALWRVSCRKYPLKEGYARWIKSFPADRLGAEKFYADTDPLPGHCLTLLRGIFPMDSKVG